MAKIDKLKEQKSDLKEIFKALIYLILGLLTGIVTLVYQILIHKIPAYMVIFAGVGLIVLFFISLYTLRLWNKMQQLNEELEYV